MWYSSTVCDSPWLRWGNQPEVFKYGRVCVCMCVCVSRTCGKQTIDILALRRVTLLILRNWMTSTYKFANTLRPHSPRHVPVPTHVNIPDKQPWWDFTRQLRFITFTIQANQGKVTGNNTCVGKTCRLPKSAGTVACNYESQQSHCWVDHQGNHVWLGSGRTQSKNSLFL